MGQTLTLTLTLTHFVGDRETAAVGDPCGINGGGIRWVGISVPWPAHDEHVGGLRAGEEAGEARLRPGEAPAAPTHVSGQGPVGLSTPNNTATHTHRKRHTGKQA